MALTYFYDEGGNGHWWYEVAIPQWYRDTAKQTENYAGKPLIGWTLTSYTQKDNAKITRSA